MKKRTLSLLLTLALLLSTAVLFTSCGKKTVDLTEYGVVCGRDASETTMAEISSFADRIEDAAGRKPSVKKVSTKEPLEGEEKREILIGNTNRPETAKALKKINGHGYIITPIGSKIVIVGTTNLLTMLALDLFVDTYLAGKEKTKEIEIEKTVVEELSMLEVTQYWSFIYNRNLDGVDDLVNVEVDRLKTQMEQFSSVNGKVMKQLPDTDSANEEILVGMVDREEYRAVVSGMNANDYGLVVKNGKLLATGLSDAMVGRAILLLKDALADSVCEMEVEGEKQKLIFIPTDLSLIYTQSGSKLLIDFPKPDGLFPLGTQDVYQATEYYYEGEGVSAEAYNAYCQKLISLGYRLYGNRAEVENSIFATYVNENTNLALTVSYNDFKHAEAQGISYNKAIRIVAAKLDAYNLADEKLFTRDLSYKKIQESAITAVSLSYNEPGVFGSFYVVSLEDGSFIVLDGGDKSVTDRDKLYKILLDLYKKADHDTDNPTATDPIRIAAWYLTHGHGDHQGSMRAFINHYCASYDSYYITIDRLITNFPSDEENYNSANPNNLVRNSLAESCARIEDAPGEEQGMKYYRVHTGQRFWLAGTELEIIYTHEEAFPRRFHYFNDTSTVIRMNMYHTENGAISEGSGTSMLWLGDIQHMASKWMRTTYGEYLKSDMVQVSHHGGKGGEWPLYQLIAPMCAWWPCSRASYSKFHTSSTSVTAAVQVDYKINYKLPSIEYCVLSDLCNYTVTLTPTGFDFTLDGSATDIFNAASSMPVSYARISDFIGGVVAGSGLLRR